MARKAGGRSASRMRAVVTLLLIVLLAIGLIALSPVVLGLYGGATPEWERLSFIGQTYGAASAILSVLALIGVVVTLRLQANETKLGREEARRAAIGELLKMAMEDPDLDERWGPVPSDEDAKSRRQLMYVNMILSEWQMSFETRALGEARLRAISREMFDGPIGRKFWRTARDVRISTSETKAARRFHEILDEEYQRALSSRAIAKASGDARPGRRDGVRWTRRILAVIAAVGGAAAAVEVIRRSRAR